MATSPVVVASTGAVQFLGMGCRIGADCDWQQQELKPTAQATARIRVVTFIKIDVWKLSMLNKTHFYTKVNH